MIPATNVWDLTCAECSCTNIHQPCEACPNYWAQKPYKEPVRVITFKPT